MFRRNSGKTLVRKVPQIVKSFAEFHRRQRPPKRTAERTDFMKYITTLEASENWKISERMTRKYCIQGRIPGAIQKDKTWLIPEDAQKPSRVAAPEGPEPLPPLALKLICQKKEKLPWFIRLCPDKPHLLFLPDGKQPADPEPD